MRFIIWLSVLALTSTPALAASKTHTIVFGKWQVIDCDSGGNARPVQIRIRALYVDGKLKDYTTGLPHEVTERVFVIGRVFRLNDTLPADKQPRWIWQRVGWLQVDRTSGRTVPLNLPNFDPGSDALAWYRDYVAYCGLSEDETHLYAIVVQLGIRKPLLRRVLDQTGDRPSCALPTWQRNPTRVEFLANGQKFSFSVKGRALELLTSDEDADAD